MDDIQPQFVKNILSGAASDLKESGTAFAPSNIALCKYWGKRNAELNLPVNSSLSVSLGQLGTRTEVRLCEGESGSVTVYLNGEKQSAESSFARRVAEFIHLFPGFDRHCLKVCTENTVPTAAGLASSASGFAALVLALNDLGGWQLDTKKLSMLARLGSGSAARSVYDGFVQWHAGSSADGTDSFAERLSEEWPALRIGILELSSAEKPVGSRDGMNRTVQTSELYQSWPVQAEKDLTAIRNAISNRDFAALGKTAECNALAMHATMMAAWPPLIYFRPETVEQIQKVQRVRDEGLEVYLTIDAGPNIKLLFLEETRDEVASVFPGLQVIRPFG
ncbi:MAG TPA: diphosphomevalonate decarboxylase [Pontiella sp.]